MWVEALEGMNEGLVLFCRTSQPTEGKNRKSFVLKACSINFNSEEYRQELHCKQKLSLPTLFQHQSLPLRHPTPTPPLPTLSCPYQQLVNSNPRLL